MDEAQRLYDECLELTRQVGDTRALANAVYNDAFPGLVGRESTPKARLLLTEALALFRQLGDEAGVARTLWGLGNADYFDEENSAARKVLEEAERLFRKLDDRFGLGWCLHTLGLAAIKLGDPAAAAKAWLEAITLFEAAHDVAGLVFQVDNLSVIARLGGDLVTAARLAAAASAHQVTSGTGLAGLVATQEGRTGREGLTEEDASKAWAEGQAMSLEQAVAEAKRIPVPEADKAPDPKPLGH
jgi:tetratricopeptide (TPR) repeat protein